MRSVLKGFIFLLFSPLLAFAEVIDYVTVQGQVSENGKTLASFEYHNNGQIVKAIRENGIENFEWDGLALIERSGTKYINEPHAGGGNPVLAILGENTNAIFNDVLGTSLGVAKDDGYSAIDKTSFGADSTDKSSFFTGKPYVEDLGYAFLFRNYRADLGKWQMCDPIGYPDGWNNLAYCNNYFDHLDLFGSFSISVIDVNNSNRVVTSVSDLRMGNISNGGSFGMVLSGISAWKNNSGELVIEIPVNLSIQKNAKKSKDYKKGEIVSYLPHSSTATDCNMYPAMYEVILAHELGHATNFFTNSLNAINSYLRNLNIDETKSIDFILENYDIADAIINADNSTMNSDRILSNNASFSAFDSTWRRIDPLNGWYRWEKVE